MKKFFGIVLIWGLILGGGAVAYKQLVLRDESPPQGSRERPSALPEVTLALDSFSGYCIFRSPEFKKKLADQGLDFTWVDDKADYAKRMESIQSGKTPLAAFTIDALIEQTPRTGEPPAAIVMLIDETRGADAMVSYRQGLPDVDDLNHKSAKVVLVENSPSETLLRVVRGQFNLPALPTRRKDYLIGAESAEDVYKKFLATAPGERKAFVLWEPYVSQALKQPGAQLLVDSSRFKGFIVDVLVAQQDYLRQHPDRVQMVVRTYLELLHERQRKTSGMADEVFDDAARVGEKLTREESEQVAKGIWWKNTVENYAHFRLLEGDQTGGLLSVAEMIKNITVVLDKTKEPGTPSPGVARPDKLVNDDVLRRLYGLRPSLHLDQQTITAAAVAADIPADRWQDLRRVGSLRVPAIGFRKNTATLAEEGDKPEDPTPMQVLDELARELERWPQYYLRVEGHTLTQGDPDANRQLAEDRAKTVKSYLVKQGVADHRIQAVAMPPGKGTEVRFVVLQAP